MNNHILLIDCPDQPGLVHDITGVLFRNGCNVLANQEYVDPASLHFFMRTEFTGPEDPAPLLDELRGRLSGARIRLSPTGKRPVVILATKEPHCLGDLLLRHAYAELPLDVRAVVGNHASLGPLATQFGIPFHHVPHEDMERREHENAIEAVIAGYDPAYLVLAKYMRVLSPEFVRRYPLRIINIHHSFLPAFLGARPYHQAFERGVKVIGATAHFVTDELDMGPIITQDVMPVDHAFTAASMAQAGRDVEKRVLAGALKLVLEERVFVHGNRTIVFD